MKKSKKFIELCKKHEVNPDLVTEVTSLEAAFKMLKLDMKKTTPKLSNVPEFLRGWLIQAYYCAILVRALNTDENGKVWEPDYNNSDEAKWEIWWNVIADAKNPSGSGLSYNVYVYWDAYSVVPARLSLRNRDTAIFAGKQFPKVFAPFQLIWNK